MSYAGQLWCALDNTTLAQFQTWGSFLSAGIASSGWVQQNDTGQAVWTATVLTLSQVASAAGNSVYTYSSYTGPAPRVGMSVTITGFATGGNNVTATLTAVSGGSNGTVTVATTTQGNETHAASGTTTVSSLPGTNSFIYEIWAPADALQTGSTAYYMRLDYGTVGSSIPSFKIQLGTSTDGAGTLTGTTLTQVQTATMTRQSALSDCYVSGDTGRLAFILWRNATASGHNTTCIERTLGTDGNAIGDGVFLYHSSNNVCKFQGIIFGIGATTQYSKIPFIYTGQTTATDDMFNGSTPLSPTFPEYGKFGNPFTVFCVLNGGDLPDGGLVTTSLYGATRTYLVDNENGAAPGTAVGWAIRYD